MKEKINQKGFIQIPILIAIIVSITAISVGGYGGFEYYKTSKIVKEAEQLTKEEKYDEAIKKLELVPNKWVGKLLKQKITNKIEENKKLLEDKLEYTQGIEEFNKRNWERAKELLSKVSENSPYYRDAKNKLNEVENRLIEEKVAEKVKRIEKESQRKIEEEKAKRIATEIQLQFEKQLTQQQLSEIERIRREAAKRWAEAETKLRGKARLSISNLLQDYYNEIRKLKDLGKEWWEGNDYDYQNEVKFAAYLAQHDIAKAYWPEYEEKYHSYSGSYSYLDAESKLWYAVFSQDTSGVNSYDSDYEKVNKILNFVRFYVYYSHDMNDILRAPVETLALQSGDCDDYSILVSAMLAEAGINSAIMFVKSIDGSEAHAMLLFQSEEIFPGLYFYPDLTSLGLPEGRWYILEPQYTIEEHQQNPDWFKKWNIVATALVSGEKRLTGSGEYKKSESVSPAITVIFPNGGERLIEGNEYIIRWSGSNLPSDAKISILLFRKSDNASIVIANNLPATQREYKWRVTTGGDWAVGYKWKSSIFARILRIKKVEAVTFENYKIMVTAHWGVWGSQYYGNIWDTSDDWFLIEKEEDGVGFNQIYNTEKFADNSYTSFKFFVKRKG